MSAVELATGVHETVVAALAELRVRRGLERGSRRSACWPPARARTHRRSGTRRSSPAATASARSTARCVSSPAASRPSRCTCTSASPIRKMQSVSPTGCAATCRCFSRSRQIRRSGRAATPDWHRRARPSSRPSRVSGIPLSSAITPRTSRRSTCSCARARSRSPPTCGGTCALSHASARSRSARWTRRRPHRQAGLVALVQSPRPPPRPRRATPRPRLLDRPEVLEENRFLAARDGVEAELVDPDQETLGPRPHHPLPAAPRASAARPGARLRRGARRRRGAGRVPVRPPPAGTYRASRAACPAWSSAWPRDFAPYPAP